MSSNQSSMVYLTRLADWLGAPWLVVFHLALCLAGLLALAAVALTNHREDLWYLLVLVWVSLLLVLLPFTRYYDVLFIAPLWAALGAVRWQTSVLWMRTRWILPVTPFFMLGHNPVFAIVAVVTLGLGLVAISSRVKLPKREDVIEFLAGILSARAISPCGIALLAIIALGMGVHRSMPSSAASLDAIVAAADLTLPDAKGHLLVMASPATIHASANYAEIFSFDPQRVDALIESLSDPGDNDAVVVSYRHLRRLAALETDGRLHRVAANEHFVLLREHSDRSATDEPRR